MSTIRINSNTREHDALPGRDLLVAEIVAAAKEGRKAFMVSVGGQKMPITDVNEVDPFVEFTLANGETRKFRLGAKVRVELKGSSSTATKVVQRDRKAEKKAKDRALRLKMKGAKK